MEVLSENLVEKIVNVKQKLQEIQNYIISNDLPIDIKLEHSNLDNFNFIENISNVENSFYIKT